MAPFSDIEEKLRQYLEGNASQEVLEEVRLWAASDPDHQAQLEKLEALWGRAAGSAMYREIDSQADWQKVRQRLQASDTAPSGGSSTSSPARRRRIWTLAATVLLLATLSVFFLRRGSDPQMLIAETQSTGQQISLADGSKVTLRPHSRLRYPDQFAENERLIELEEGAAFFDVERNPEKPFIINAGPSRVEVKGTSFSVTRKGLHTSVAVKTGQVRFYLPDNQAADVTLIPGQKADLSPATKEIATQTTTENQFSWVTGRLIFSNVPIPQILDELSSHFNVPIVIGDEMQLSGKQTTEFVDQTLEEVLEEMKVVMHIEYRIENDTVFVQ
jgi:ferric-dicitrate binding protein FerR (iron transport regulator)